MNNREESDVKPEGTSGKGRVSVGPGFGQILHFVLTGQKKGGKTYLSIYRTKMEKVTRCF